MSRSNYLTNKDVEAFTAWFASNIDSKTKFFHTYTSRRSGDSCTFQSLPDALSKYKWPHGRFGEIRAGDTLESSGLVLDHLESGLQAALSRRDDQEVTRVAVDVMAWGGVVAGNRKWLHGNAAGAAERIEKTRKALAEGDILSPVLRADDLRFNAGMTKVYSLLVEDFIIYDSRVAAALGWIVAKYCAEMSLDSVPPLLQFPWAPAKSSVKAPNPKNRNPSTGEYKFPKLSSGKHHAEWNLKASWLLSEVLRRANDDTVFNAVSSKALRSLEAALFMIGYDLPSSAQPAPVDACAVNHETKEALHSPVTVYPDSPSWTECYTTRHGNKFYYRLDEDGIHVHNDKSRKSFTNDVINRLLNELAVQFGGEGFPLANSATDVRHGKSSSGVGTAYFTATNSRGNPPDCSKLAAVLEDLGIFIPARSPKGWKLSQEVHHNGTGNFDVAVFLGKWRDLEDGI